MSPIRALLWKEWCEARPYLGIALFVFLGLPLVGTIEGYIQYHRIELAATDWVYLFGGVMAVVISVGVVVGDLNGRVEQFWRSRPVSTLKWLLIKYFVGLGSVLVALILPLAVELWINPRNISNWSNPRSVLWWNPYLWTAAFSIAFAIACLIRRGAHAAMLSIAALLLLYFLPRILPPIGFLSMHVAMEVRSSTAKHWAFVLGMLAIAGIALAMAIVAVRRDWRIEPDRRMIYWSIGGALLILFASAAFQVATNLPLLASASGKVSRANTLSIFCDGSNGIRFLRVRSQDPQGPDKLMLQRFHISDKSIWVDAPIEHDAYRWPLWRPQRPDVLYQVNAGWQRDYGYSVELQTIQIVGQELQTKSQSFPNVFRDGYSMRLFADGDRLFMYGRQMLVFDISDPLNPRHISTSESWTELGLQMIRDGRRIESSADQNIQMIALPQAPGLSPRQRLQMAGAQLGGWANIQGDLLVVALTDGLTTYHLEGLTDELATFRKVGRYEMPPLQRMFRSYGLYGSGRGGDYVQMSASMLLRIDQITFFDVEIGQPREIGHYAFPSESVVPYVLPDGRILASGTKNLYLLGPPPRRD